ncbi:MAG: two-component system histidine kinase PnpS [Deltaproteobacteria bacterium]
MAKKKSLLWHVFFSYLLVILLSLVAVIWLASNSMRDFFLDKIQDDLQARALLFENYILEHVEPLDAQSIDQLCKKIGPSAFTRLTVILPSGRVIGDSEGDPVKMDNHLDRPEILAAMEKDVGVSTRYSPTLAKQLMYVAVPLKKNTRTVAYVRAAIEVGSVDRDVEAIQIKMALSGLVIAGLATLLSLLVSHRIRRPIDDIRRGAERFAHGDFQNPLPVSDLKEIGDLSETLNLMAQELQKTVSTITEQRNELGAVLSSMAEGVLAMDMEERILGMNRAASLIFECDPKQVQGRTIQEVIRHPELQNLVTKALASEGAVERDVVLYLKEERVLNGHGTILRDGEGKRVGVLVVLNDITRLRKLENIRKDFVANVSHEIRTPITAIKGFVETLRDGAMQSPEDAERFLGIIQNHVLRLESLVEDLLSLSRIEEDEEKDQIALEEKPLREVLVGAVQLCQVKAESKQVRMELSCGEDAVARINSSLLGQAVVNLLDNAIKYSEQGKTIWVQTESLPQEILIRVRDEGCGIEKKHQDRLFERFYRVDKARSRKLGGTGLGLSIVKHIMEAHGGRVSVESQPGRGSIFTLHLPR